MSSGTAVCDRVNLVQKTITRILEDEAVDSTMRRHTERELAASKNLTPKWDSRCLLCGHWYYGQELEKCPKCGGLCRICPPDELTFSFRMG